MIYNYSNIFLESRVIIMVENLRNWKLNIAIPVAFGNNKIGVQK